MKFCTSIFLLNRKLMHTISQVIPAYGLLGLAYVGCNQSMSIFWLCVCVGFNGAVYSGFFGNHMELSPNYAGTLMGFTNMAANITGNTYMISIMTKLYRLKAVQHNYLGLIIINNLLVTQDLLPHMLLEQS